MYLHSTLIIIHISVLYYAINVATIVIPDGTMDTARGFPISSLDGELLELFPPH